MNRKFVKEEGHWLRKFAPREWISAALGELSRAEKAYGERNARAGLAGARRAAGMGLNARLVAEPNEAYGRSYVDHLRALVRDGDVPEAVRGAAQFLMEEPEPSKEIVVLQTRSHDRRVIEAARDVIAHAYAMAVRNGAITSIEEKK